MHHMGKQGETPHFHPVNKNGEILKNGVHHQYGSKKGK